MPDKALKKQVTDMLYEILVEREEYFATGAHVLRCETQRVSPLTIQFKVWESNGPPRYLNVKVSEMI